MSSRQTGACLQIVPGQPAANRRRVDKASVRLETDSYGQESQLQMLAVTEVTIASHYMGVFSGRSS